MKAELVKALKEAVGHFKGSALQPELIGIGSTRLQPGYTGKISDIAFEALDENSGANKVTRDQFLSLPDKDGKLVRTKVAEKGVDFPVVLNFVFEDGRRFSINALKQSPMSSIDGVKAVGITLGEYHEMIGKTIRLENTDDDTKTTIRRPNAANNNALEARNARYFEFVTA